MLTKFENFFLGHIRSKLNSHEGAMFDELMQKLQSPHSHRDGRKYYSRNYIKLDYVHPEKVIHCIKTIREYFTGYSLSSAKTTVDIVRGGTPRTLAGWIPEMAARNFVEAMESNGHSVTVSTY